MKITPKAKLSEEGQVILNSLQKAVTQELEKKRRLGHYAVVCRDGKPMMIGEDAPKVSEDTANY